MNGRFADNPNYIEYERLQRELHRLIAEGKGETEEADTLRDRMDIPWRGLSDEEAARLRGLSADLYMLQGDEIYEPLDPADNTPERHDVQIRAAWNRHDWEEILSLLRKGPGLRKPLEVACLRGTAYMGLGDSEAALLFLEYALRQGLPPGIGRWTEAIVMSLHMKLGRLSKAAVLAEELIQANTHDADIHILSAAILFVSTEKLSRGQARPVLARVAAILEQALRESPSSDSATLGNEVLSMIQGMPRTPQQDYGHIRNRVSEIYGEESASLTLHA